jgi:hypothetical protein
MIKKMQDASRALNPFLEIEKTMGVAYNKQNIEVANIIQNTFRAPNSILEIDRTIGIAYNAQITEIVNKMQDTYRATNSILNLEKTMGAVYNKQNIEVANMMQDIIRERNHFVEIEATLTSSLFSNIHKEHMSLANIVGNISPILDFYQKMPVDGIVFNKGQTIICGPEAINIDSLQDIVQHILTSISMQNNYIDNILIEIRKLKNPFLEKIVVGITINLLISLLMAFITPANKVIYNYYSCDNKQIIKHIKTEVSRTNIDLILLRIYRIVSIDELNVRAKNRKSSKLIGKVYFGQIVKVVDKEKNWSLIEWKGNDETSDLVIRGWVFSRYLKKFN